MPSEKSDLCWESDCVFEPLLLSAALRGQRASEAKREAKGGAGVGASRRVECTGGGGGGGENRERRSGSFCGQLQTQQINGVCVCGQTAARVLSPIFTVMLSSNWQEIGRVKA